MIGLFERLGIGLLMMKYRERGRVVERGYPTMRRDLDDVKVLMTENRATYVEIPGLGFFAAPDAVHEAFETGGRAEEPGIHVSLVSRDILSDTMRDVLKQLVEQLQGQQGGR